MKKKLLATVLVLSMTLSTVSVLSFADTTEFRIQTAEQLKAVMATEMGVGKLTEAEKVRILSFATEDAVQELLIEKVDTAIEVLADSENADINILPEGKNYVKHEVDLGDGCTLNVELMDIAETKDGDITIKPMATSGSQNLWKDYGDRYFTAKATISCSTENITFILENHYTLSANGIDERYGIKDYDTEGILIVEIGSPQILDSSARTPGASDASIECSYSCRLGKNPAQHYKLVTTVKYLELDKTGKRIRVGQAWSLVKTS